MADPSSLIVPINLQALLVNSKVRAQGFQRWTMQYQELAKFNSPEPAPFQPDPEWFTSPANDGVWLHWRIPAALRHGVHDTATATTSFPLVPNRWIVIRYSGPLSQRTATAWIVESDFLDPNLGSSSWVDPSSSSKTTRIGISMPLEGWSESGTTPLFLTAVAPGNIQFTMYQPYADNVFSIHDPLDGVVEGEVLSYLVAGWYSDPSSDILAGWDPTTQSFAAFAASLGLLVTGDESATASIYEGFVFGLTWSSTVNPPRIMLLDQQNTLAVGNTAIDALTSLVAVQPNAPDPELLQAFQYDLIRLLDQPDGAGLLRMAVERGWFAAYPGGHVWEIVAAPSGGSSEDVLRRQSVNGALDDPAWLFTLNRSQAVYDAALLEVAQLQWQLYVTWWKFGNGSAMKTHNQPVGFPAPYQSELDPAVDGSLINRVMDAFLALQILQAAVPWGNTPDELARSIAAYAAAHELPATMQLRRGDLPGFSEVNDPVVVITGAKAESIESEPDPLPCRFQTQLVTGFTFDGMPITTTTMGASIPTVNLSAVPAIAGPLVGEFFFLDPNDAAIVAAVAVGDPLQESEVREVMAGYGADIGTLPAMLPGPWSQPWAPLFLLWQVTFYPIEYLTEGAPNWTFDGSDYTWNGSGAQTAGPLTFSGRTFLTPSCSVNLESCINGYLQTYPNAALEELEEFVGTADQWDFLAQSLSGFNDQLLLQSAVSLLAPDDTGEPFPNVTMATLIGSAAASFPVAGQTQPVFGEWPPSHFQQIRSGQFLFSRVTVVDRFGQSVDIVDSSTYQQFVPVVVPEMTPQQKVTPVGNFVQTAPRLLQPARLDLDFVSATDDAQILDLDAGVNPICAWILSNHLDQSLACYGPTGNALGEVYAVTNDQQQSVVDWFPAPNSPYLTIGSLATDYPHLTEFLAGLQYAGEASLAAMLTVIDETLATIDPLGANDDQFLSALIGRPLALVRTRLHFSLNGPPNGDPGWQYATPPPAAYPEYSFNIRLGDATLRDDGTIGYFNLGPDGDYNQFNTVYSAGVSDSYVVPIGADNYLELQFQETSVTCLTLLVDPRAPVNAFTGILPVTSLAIPQSFIDGALANMNVTFRTGPILSNEQLPQAGTPRVVMPQPAEKRGTWSWIELDGATMTSYGITPPSPVPQFPNTPPTLRTGWLQLNAALGDSLTGTGQVESRKC